MNEKTETTGSEHNADKPIIVKSDNYSNNTRKHFLYEQQQKENYIKLSLSEALRVIEATVKFLNQTKNEGRHEIRTIKDKENQKIVLEMAKALVLLKSQLEERPTQDIDTYTESIDEDKRKHEVLTKITLLEQIIKKSMVNPNPFHEKDYEILPQYHPNPAQDFKNIENQKIVDIFYSTLKNRQENPKVLPSSIKAHAYATSILVQILGRAKKDIKDL